MASFSYRVFLVSDSTLLETTKESARMFSSLRRLRESKMSWFARSFEGSQGSSGGLQDGSNVYEEPDYGFVNAGFELGEENAKVGLLVIITSAYCCHSFALF
mgnify:CR=1 FL=1